MAVIKSLSAVILLAGLSLLCSCGKSGSERQPPNSPAAPSPTLPATPFAVVTKSGVNMIYLPGGDFMMGSSQGNADEGPVHKVTLSSFLMDTYPVTHEMFTKVQLPDPSHWQDNPNKPVERVRWRDAKQYCNERSMLEGLKPCYNEKTMDWECDYSASGYRLPTEAEWEYAARAGADGPYDFGPPDKLSQYAWFADNSDEKTHPVGQKKPNLWGLHDMYGNVSEWCEDVYSPTLLSAKRGGRSARAAQSGQGRQARHARWFLEIERGHVPGHFSPRPAHRRHRRLFLHRFLRLSLCAAGFRARNCNS